jgi:serine/threonine-protein kinase
VLLLRRASEPIPTAVSPNGVVLFAEGSQTGLRAIWTLRLEDGFASEFLATPAMEHMAMFSPDGTWVAYVSNESGRDEVYVRPYPKTDGVGRRVSLDGGTAPVWARDGSELYYRSASGDLMALPTTMKPSFTPGRPQPLFRFSGRFRVSGNASAYDVLRDGKQFVMVTEPTTPVSELRQVNVVENWFEELKRLVPTN